MRRTAALTVLVALIASACGGPSAIELISAAPDAAASEGSVKMQMLMVFRVEQGEQYIQTVARGTGAVDLARERGRMNMTVELPESFGVEIPECELVFDHNFMYVSVPPSQGQSGPPRWLKADVSDVDGFDAGTFSADPIEPLDYIKGVSGDVEEVERIRVRDVETTHYRFSVKKDRLLEELDGPDRAEAEETLTAAGVTEIPFDAYIDDDGLPRRLDFKLEGEEDGASFKMESSIELFDYGEPVSVEIPPASETRDDTPEAALAGCFGAAPS